jgi:hypothetical protein
MEPTNGGLASTAPVIVASQIEILKSERAPLFHSDGGDLIRGGPRDRSPTENPQTLKSMSAVRRMVR